MPTVVDALVVTLGLDSSGFAKGQRDATTAFNKTRTEAVQSAKLIEESNKKLAETFAKLRNEALGFFAVLLGARGVKDFVANVTSANTALGNLAANLGESPQMLSAWGNAVERMGGRSDEAATSISSLAKAFYDLRYNGKALPQEIYRVYAAAGKVPDTAHGLDKFLNDTAEALQRIAQHDRTAAYFFGQGMGLSENMVNLMLRYGAGTAQFVKSLEGLSPSSGAIAAAQKLTESWTNLSQTVVSLGNAITEKLSPVLPPLLDEMAKWVDRNRDIIASNVAQFVKDLGDYLARIDWNAIAKGVSDFASAAKGLADALGGVVKISEALFAIWAANRILGLVSGVRAAAGAVASAVAATGAGGRLAAGAVGSTAGALALPLALSGDTRDQGGGISASDAQNITNAYQAAHGGFWHQLGTSLFGDSMGGSDSKYYNDFESRRGKALSVNGRDVSKGNPVPVTLDTGGQSFFDWLFGGGSTGAGGGGGGGSAAAINRAAGGGPVGHSAARMIDRRAAGRFPSGENPTTGTGSAQSVASRLMRDYGLTREQAIGATGVMGYESGNFQTMQEQGRSGWGSGWGWAQWTGPRRHAFMDWASSHGLDPSSDAANYGFLQHELATNYSHVIPIMRRQSSVRDSAYAFERYYEGMTEGGPGIPAFAGHIARAEHYSNVLPQNLANDGASSASGQSSWPAWGGMGVPMQQVPGNTPLSSLQGVHPVTTSSTSNAMHVGSIHVNAPQATDATGIASSISDALGRYGFSSMAQSGQV